MAGPKNPNAALQAVTAVPGAPTNNVWAVGYGGGGALAAQWNGNGWNLFTPPTPPEGGVLASVTAISATDIWAVGSVSVMYGMPARALIEHYDGTNWSIVPSP